MRCSEPDGGTAVAVVAYGAPGRQAREIRMGISKIVKSRFFAWVDEALAQPIAEGTVAFHFNLYEGTDSVHVQIIGTDSFEATEDDLEGDETFSTGEDVFYVPFKDAGADWTDWLKSLKHLVSEYIASGERSDVLRRSRGVSIGFVDGDICVVWQPAD